MPSAAITLGIRQVLAVAHPEWPECMPETIQWCLFPFITGPEQRPRPALPRSKSRPRSVADALQLRPPASGPIHTSTRVIKASSVLIDGRTAHRKDLEQPLSEPVKSRCCRLSPAVVSALRSGATQRQL